jgi:hypothetical protein
VVIVRRFKKADEMVRVISLKSLLLLLMVIVVGLTLIFIVRCSSSPAIPSLSNFEALALARKASHRNDHVQKQSDKVKVYHN